MAGLVAAVAAEAAMEPGTVRRAGGGASVVGGTPGGAVPAVAAGDGEGRGGAPTATVRPCAADARGPERPVRRTAVLQLSVDFRPAVVRFCSGRTGIANEGRGMDETIERARTLDRAGRRIEVLILVKTTPTPSATYEDTVCVAGVALSPGPMRWVRLYPIPFRHLDSASQFQEYTVVAVDVKQPKRDGRPESLRVDLANIAIERRHEPGSARYLLMDRIERTTTCRLIAGTREDVNATSLGIVRPRDASLVLKPHRGWSASQQRSLQKWERQAPLPLGGLGHNDAPPLENPPLQAWYRYRCGGSGCSGHEQGVLDWELTALQRRAQMRRADVGTWVRDMFEARMLDPRRDTCFILGNNASASKRRSFSVLSIYYPSVREVQRARADASTLF